MARASRRTGVEITGADALVGRQLSVLLLAADDDASARVRRMLLTASSGFDVEHVRTVEAVKRRLHERRFDAVLYDCALSEELAAESARRPLSCSSTSCSTARSISA